MLAVIVVYFSAYRSMCYSLMLLLRRDKKVVGGCCRNFVTRDMEVSLGLRTWEEITS